MSNVKIEVNLKRLNFPNRSVLTDILNELKIQNVHKNQTHINDFVGQLEIGAKTSIPHYQLAISAASTCTKKKVLEEKVEGHINVEIQFNLEDMKNYCSKETNFISEKYSGKIYKHQWEMDFLERKPQLKEVLNNPFLWQKFIKEDRMELTLIKKIEKYRIKYYKDPKVIFFDFPRASDPSKIMSATALMEDTKSGHLVYIRTF